MPETDNRAARIEAFLASGAWQIAEDRVLTRRALVETLAALPAVVLNLLFAVNRVLVLAPCCHMDSTVHVFTFQANAQGVETCVLYFDHRFEGYDYEKVLRIVRRNLALACAKLSGLDSARAAQIASAEAAQPQGRPC